VAFLALQRGKDLDINAVFQMEMRIVCQCVEPAVTTDFINGVDQVLVKPKKDKSERGKRPAWNPNTLKDIDVKQIESDFFSGPLRTKFPVPKLQNKGETYKEYPHIKFALPREEQIGKIIKGETSNSGAYAIKSEQELLDKLNKEWNNKPGLKAKVQDVLARRTIKDKEGNLKWSY
jgi:3-hydroxyisobutyryl-CoA hydrolase